MDLEDALGEVEFKDGIPDVRFSKVVLNRRKEFQWQKFSPTRKGLKQLVASNGEAPLNYPPGGVNGTVNVANLVWRLLPSKDGVVLTLTCVQFMYIPLTTLPCSFCHAFPPQDIQLHAPFFITLKGPHRTHAPIATLSHHLTFTHIKSFTPIPIIHHSFPTHLTSFPHAWIPVPSHTSLFS